MSMINNSLENGRRMSLPELAKNASATGAFVNKIETKIAETRRLFGYPPVSKDEIEKNATRSIYGWFPKGEEAKDIQADGIIMEAYSVAVVSNGEEAYAALTPIKDDDTNGLKGVQEEPNANIATTVVVDLKKLDGLKEEPHEKIAQTLIADLRNLEERKVETTVAPLQ